MIHRARSSIDKGLELDIQASDLMVGIYRLESKDKESYLNIREYLGEFDTRMAIIRLVGKLSGTNSSF